MLAVNLLVSGVSKHAGITKFLFLPSGELRPCPIGHVVETARHDDFSIFFFDDAFDNFVASITVNLNVFHTRINAVWC